MRQPECSMRALLCAIASSSCIGLAFAPRAAAQDSAAAALETAPTDVVADASAESPTPSGLAEVELLSAAELTALGIDTAEPSVDNTLKLSGFADFGFGATLNGKESFWRGSGSVPSSPTFFVGNLNVYLDKQLTETIRTMAEIRFSYLPNGSRGYGFEERVDTEASDYVDFGRFTRWGAIIIQRIYVEWAPIPLLTLRAGQFLTPYGVWNVDHGSPVFIPVRRPWSIGIGWIPEKQTGLELYGRAVVSPSNTVGYHLTLSNGTGPISEYADLDDNKAIGGRLFWEFRGLGLFRLGGSAYYGRHTDSIFISSFSGGSVSTREQLVVQYDTLSWALDLTWEVGDLHIQSEWLFSERAFTEKGRVLQETRVGALLPADMPTWGGYALIGYRLPWLGIMPFFLTERTKGGVDNVDISLATIQFGLNIRPVDELVLKATYEQVWFEDDVLEPLKVFLTQVAWAF